MNEKQVKTILSVRPADTKSLPSYEYLEQLTINQATKIYMLEHNWNELKSWLIKKMNEYVTYQGDLSFIYEEVFDKAVELEEGGNNEFKK